jgi:HSP20 family protein
MTTKNGGAFDIFPQKLLEHFASSVVIFDEQTNQNQKQKGEKTPMNLKSIIPWKKEDQALARRGGGGDPFTQLQRQMNSVFDDFLGRSSSDLWGGGAGEFLPQIDLSETGKEVRVTAELPGLDQKDVEVTVTNNMLTIKGEKKVEKEEEEGDYYHAERSYGYFNRTIVLPEGIDADKAKAKFKNGVLKVTIPKKPEAQSARKRIELNGG